MSSSPFSTSPSWILQPSALQNVFLDQFASLKDVPSYVQVSNFPSFLSGLKQALYWRRRLAPSATPNTVIFSLLGDKGLLVPNILEVCQSLRSVCDMSHLVEVYHAPNSSFIGISFSNSSVASIFRTVFTYYNNSLVVHVAPSTSLIHQFKLLWLPPLFPDTRIHHFLSKHSVHHHFSRVLVRTDDNISTPSNSISGTLELAPHQDINKIPHLIPLPSPHLGSALFIISGRPSLCLKCGSIGHLRRSCPSPKCLHCHRYHATSSSCSSISAFADSSDFNPWPSDDAVIDQCYPAASTTSTSVSDCEHTFATSALDPSSSIAFSLPANQELTNEPSSNLNCNQVSLNTTLMDISHDFSNPDGPFTISKCITRSMSSSKRTHSTSSLPDTALSSSIVAHTNMFDHLIDQVPSLSAVSVPIAPTSPSSCIIESAPLHMSFIQSTVLESDSAASTSLISASLPLHKRAKFSSNKHPSSKSQIAALVPAPAFPSSSWGDRVEEEHTISANSDPTHSISSFPIPSSSDPAQSFILPTNPLIDAPDDFIPASDAVSDSPAQSSSSTSSTLSSTSISSFYDSTISSRHHLLLSGFPNKSSRSRVLNFLDPHVPTALWHIRGSSNSLIGTFGATFASADVAFHFK